jgi:hypothetical protein
MKYKDSYTDSNGKKCIVTHLREVFEEIKKPEKPSDYIEYDDGLDDDDEDEYEFVDECPCAPGKKPKKMFEVDEVLGSGHSESYVEICIPLCPPAVQVFDCLAREEIKFDALIAKKDKVFINGRLLKCIPYCAKKKFVHPSDCCSGHINKNTGNAIAEVPFMMCISVPGAIEGGRVVVLDYDITAVNIPNRNCGCLIKSITEKDCISVKVKVVKPVIVPLPNNLTCEY